MRLEQKFLAAAQRQPQLDASLQNALAVLYNLNGNFDRAVDSIRAALGANPEVFITSRELTAYQIKGSACCINLNFLTQASFECYKYDFLD